MTTRWYYRIKRLLPRWLQITLRRIVTRRRLRSVAAIWPVCPTFMRDLRDFPGWPEGKEFALLLRHDVESAAGVSRSGRLAAIDRALGFRASFNLVPERYPIPPGTRERLEADGFEVGVHGLHHDGLLYASRRIFEGRAQRINAYLRQWGSAGFYSPAAHHRLDWLHRLDIEYDSSTFDTDPFEPQPDGAASLHPFWVPAGSDGQGYVELPYTLAQDFTLFVLLGRRDIDTWKTKLDWIAARGGMAFLNVHPDYLLFEGEPRRRFRYPAALYVEFLEHLRSAYAGRYWHALPREMARFWRDLVHRHGSGKARDQPRASLRSRSRGSAMGDGG